MMIGRGDGPQRMRALGWRVVRSALTATGVVAGIVAVVGIVTTAEGLLAWERLNPTRMHSVIARGGVFGAHRPGAPLRLALMGDSLAVGYGAADLAETPGALLAQWLADAADRPVVLTNVGLVGAESTALVAQLGQLREQAPRQDVVVIIVGANDAMHVKRLTDALWPLSATVRDLRHAGVQVVVATCPDLGTVRPFSQPLRFFAHWYGRVLATGQAIVVLRAGGRTVSLADTLGPIFRSDPKDMFSPHDHLHPSSRGYGQAAQVILPSVLAAAGIPSAAHTPHRVYRRGHHHPLAWWAFRASKRVGARLTAAEGAGFARAAA